MSAISLKSITGITSITTPAGLDNQLTLHTNNTVERLRITSNGRVGIGTDNPSDLFDVHKSSSTAYDATDDDAQRNDGASITVRNDNGTTNSFSQLVFDTGGSNQSIARIVAIRKGSATNDLAFVTEHSNTKAERLRITSNGDLSLRANTQNAFLGLKANSTAINLTLGSTSGTAPRAYFYGTGNGQSTAGDIFLGAGTGGELRFRAGQSIKLQTNSDSSTIDAFFIHAAGTVAVNTFSPDTTYKLDVSGAGQFTTSSTNQQNDFLTGQLTVKNNQNAQGAFIDFRADSANGTQGVIAKIGGFNTHNGSGYDGLLTFSTRQNSNNTMVERMRIRNDGNVGIGTNGNDHRLAVRKDSTITNYTLSDDPAKASGIVLQNLSPSLGRYAALSFQVSNSTTSQCVSILGSSSNSGTAANLNFTVRDSASSSAYVGRIDGTYKSFLIGTTSHRTAEFTHPDGFSIRGDTSKGQFQNTVTDVTGGLMNRDGSDGQILSFRREGAAVGHIGVNANTMYLNFGSTSAAAHQLDDYETGTFTCTVYYATGNTTGNHTNTTTIVGYFEKIGNLVFISISLYPSNYNSGNTAIITKFSLPHTPVTRAAAAFYRYSGAGNYGGMLPQSSQDDSGSYLDSNGFGYVIVGGTNQGSGFWGHHGGSGYPNASGHVSGSYRIA